MSNSLQDVNQALEEQESSLEADRLVTDGGRRDDEEDRRRSRGPPPWWYEDMWRRFPPWRYEWRETGEEGKPREREGSDPESTVDVKKKGKENSEDPQAHGSMKDVERTLTLRYRVK